MWDTARKATEDAEHCNFGKEPCEMGKMAEMALVPVSEADKEKHKELTRTSSWSSGPSAAARIVRRSGTRPWARWSASRSRSTSSE